MASQRDANKRFKGFGIPIEVCVKYERAAGVKLGQVPTRQQAQVITNLMVTTLTMGVQHIKLTASDYEAIAKEVKSNEQR